MNKKKLIIIGTIGTVALVGATVIPIVVINSNNDKKNKKDVVAVIKILKEKSISERTLELASDSNGKIIVDNKEEVIKKVKELIGTSKLREVLIDVSMTTDANVSIVEQAIIVTIKKGEYSQKLEGKNGLKVKRAENAKETKIAAIQTYLNKTNNLNLVLPKIAYNNDAQILAAIKAKFTTISEIGIFGANLITKKAGENNVTSIAIHNDLVTSYAITIGGEDFILKINQAQYTTTEEIKEILDAKLGNDLIITLPNTATGNIISEVVNKEAIEMELRKLINLLNTDGAINHASLKGTTITVSMDTDSPISTTLQNIIVTISKVGGASTRTTKTFQVKRNQKVSEINVDINAIKIILDAKLGNDLIITLPNTAVGNIISEVVNKEAIETELRKLINLLNTDGAINHESLKGTTITVSMDTDSPISTTLQNIIVTISKAGGASTRTTKTFQVVRAKNNAELANEDIDAIKIILDAKLGNDLIITLPSSSIGNIIQVYKEAIETELRKLINLLNTDGAINHASLKGTTITVSMDTDSPISTTLQNIIVTISKAGGASTRTTKTFQVVRAKNNAELANEDIDAIKIILDAKLGNDLIITLPSSSIGNIIQVYKEAIETELRKLINLLNTDGAINHASLKGTTITVSMDTDSPISTTLQNIIVTISKTNGISVTTSTTFQVKRNQKVSEINVDINAIKIILDAKLGNDLIITLPNTATGNIISEVVNKEAIETELRKLINSLNTDGAINHASLKGTTITVSMDTDSPISTTLQNIIVTISKVGGASTRTTKTFQVVRPKNNVEKADETINAIKIILDAKIGNDLIITLPSSSIGNIIQVYKEAIETELRKLINLLNTDGAINHASLKGTTITVSMDTDSPISTTLQNIIVTISKTNGISVTTSTTFQVKRNQKVSEINVDINAIKIILDAKIGNDLIITLPSSSVGNIIQVYKEAIEMELRKLINLLNTDGAINHASLKGTTITVSMDTDSPISTTLQNIIVTISKAGGASTRTTKTFQVVRAKNNVELANEDIKAIKEILNAKTGDDLIITLPSSFTGDKAAKKDAVEKELRKLIDPLNTDGAINHASLKGTIVSSRNDFVLSTTPQEIVVIISKTNGNSVTTSVTFHVKRNQKVSEINADIDHIWGVFKDILTIRERAIISLPSDTAGYIIRDNKNIIENTLSKIFDVRIGNTNFISRKKVTITVSVDTDSPISTTLQNIIVTISKVGGVSRVITNEFQVKKL